MHIKWVTEVFMYLALWFKDFQPMYWNSRQGTSHLPVFWIDPIVLFASGVGYSQISGKIDHVKSAIQAKYWYVAQEYDESLTCVHGDHYGEFAHPWFSSPRPCFTKRIDENQERAARCLDCHESLTAGPERCSSHQKQILSSCPPDGNQHVAHLLKQTA